MAGEVVDMPPGADVVDAPPDSSAPANTPHNALKARVQTVAMPSPGRIPYHPPVPEGMTPAQAAAQSAHLAATSGPPHSAIEQASGVVDVPGVVAGGIATGKLGEAMNQWLANPAEANRKYGILAQPILEQGAKNGNKIAQHLLAHPAQAAVGQGIIDLFNPVNDLVGGAIAKPLGKLFVGVVSKTPQGRALLNAFSPFRGIAANGGQEAKRAVQAMMVRVASEPAKAQSASLKIFGGLSPEAMDDVIHVYQNVNPSYIKTKDPEALKVIHDRADMLRQYLTGITQGKLGEDLISKEVARDRPTHFPLQDLFRRKAGTPAEERLRQFREKLRGAGGGGGASPLTRAGTEATPAVHHSLAEAQARLAHDPALANYMEQHPDWSPPVAIAKFASRSKQGTVIEQSLKKLPPTLRRDMTPADFGIQNYAKHSPFETPEQAIENARKISRGAEPKPPMDGRGELMMSWEQLAEDRPELAAQFADSPTLRRSWLSQDFINYLDKNSTRIYQEPKLYPEGKDVRSTLIRGALKTWDGYSNLMRATIVANPLVHPLWNLTNNSAGAGLPAHEVAILAARSIFSTMGQGKTVDRIVNFFDKDWAQWVSEAADAGALAEMKEGSTDALRRRALGAKNLSVMGKMALAVDKAQAWNTRLTFGPHGEEAFATALYRHLIKSGKFEGKAGQEEAAGLVREALGNYQNVDPTSWQSRLLFFYPWLKGNTAFWVRKFATNPRATLTPADMARTNNALAGDPSEKQSPAKDYQWEHKGLGGPTTPGLSIAGHQLVAPGPVGGDPNTFYRWSPLLPQRILTDVESLGTGDPTKIAKAAEKVVSTHLKPGPRTAWDLGVTSIDRASDPAQPMNFTTVYDKDAPPETQVQQIVAYVASRNAPIPLLGFQVGDAVREGGVRANEVGPMLLGAAGGGYARPETSDSAEDKMVKHARSRLNSAFIKAAKIGKKNPAKADEMKQRAYLQYEKTFRKASAPKGQEVDMPPGGTEVDAPP